MKFLKYIYSSACLLALAGCSEDSFYHQHPDVTVGEETINLDITLNLADIQKSNTRGFSGEPDYNNLKLYVFEFEGVDANDPRSNNISNNYTDSISNVTLTPHGDQGDIHFNLTLFKTDEPKILHFIAIEDDNMQYAPGYEAQMIPGIQLSANTPAYWHRMVFPAGYGTFDEKGEVFKPLENLRSYFEHIPMLCNFAKISLTSSAPDFTLEGFALLNQPDKGTVCPWNADEAVFPEFLNGSSILEYAQIYQNYSGYWPYNPTTTGNVVNRDANSAVYSTDDKYIYERASSSIYNPVVIMKGIPAGSTESSYYKLDLGYKNDNGLFEYYDILRNFEYAIDVTNVGASGYATAQEAMNGVVYNNFSFDVNTRNMLNVSDGKDMLWVNQTTFVVTQPDQTDIEILYRLKTGIKNNDGTLANENVSIIVEKGDAIASDSDITYGTVDNADGWRSIKIKTVEPDGNRKSAEVIVYDPESGLGRTISIVVRNPWVYTSAGVWGGNYNFYQQFVDNVEAREEWNGYVSTNTALGQPLTVRFHIPDDIPESLFPMTFTFESDRQNIEQNKVGNLAVVYGPSYFNESQRTMKFVKTVTWTDYNSALEMNNETGTIVDDDKDGVTNHVIRARFQTIEPIALNQETIIRIYNPYMRVAGSTSEYLEVSFRGKNGTAPDYAPDQEVDPTE